MTRTYKKKKGSKYATYSANNMAAALEAVRGGTSFRKAAEKYSVNKDTLRRKHLKIIFQKVRRAKSLKCRRRKES